MNVVLSRIEVRVSRRERKVERKKSEGEGNRIFAAFSMNSLDDSKERRQ